MISVEVLLRLLPNAASLLQQRLGSQKTSSGCSLATLRTGQPGAMSASPTWTATTTPGEFSSYYTWRIFQLRHLASFSATTPGEFPSYDTWRLGVFKL
jgi:hypothetical protein